MRYMGVFMLNEETIAKIREEVDQMEDKPSDGMLSHEEMSELL
jgi:hypothetical protein